MRKYIFITGGVVSSIGKGIAAASLGRLLKSRGYSISVEKLDPYINIDPGTMSPYQHGEVFVTEDGAETDLDLGHYERFIDINLTKECNTTTGKVYWSVLSAERRGDYLGSTIQVIPHVTDEIKKRIMAAPPADITIVEVGGTVGDIESLPFLEAIRQLKKELGADNTVFLHVAPLLYLEGARELKTKPVQHSVKELRAIGIQPDILVCRATQPMTTDMKKKLALFCDVNTTCIIENPTVKSIYEIPLVMASEHLDEAVLDKLSLPLQELHFEDWQDMVYSMQHPYKKVKIAIVGKYVELPDAYISIVEALHHASTEYYADIEIKYISAEGLEMKRNYLQNIFAGVDGILVPGGFGDRGVEGKITAAQYARENNIPYLGLCLGMQVAVIEFARNVCNLPNANSTEFGSTPHPVIALMDSQSQIVYKGGTMRLGAYPCHIMPGTITQECYQVSFIHERHRHRYEFNNKYRELLQDKGLVIAGTLPDESLVEIVELPKAVHPFFVACQFHPEFKSRPNRPHPLFTGFIKAALNP